MGMNFVERMQQKAKSNPKKVAFPKATEEKILQTASEVLQSGIGYPILVGEVTAIREAARKGGIQLEGITLADNRDAVKVEDVVSQIRATLQQFPVFSVEAHSAGRDVLCPEAGSNG